MDIFDDDVAAAQPTSLGEPDGEFDFDSFSELASVLGSPDGSPRSSSLPDKDGTADSAAGGIMVASTDKLHQFKRFMPAPAFEAFTKQATRTFPGVQLCVGSTPLRNGVLLLLPSSVVWARRVPDDVAVSHKAPVLQPNSRKTNRRESFDLVTIKAFDRAATAAEQQRQKQQGPTFQVYEFGFAHVTNLEAQHFGPITQVILDSDIIFEFEFMSTAPDSRTNADFADAFHAAVDAAATASAAAAACGAAEEPKSAEAVTSAAASPASSPRRSGSKPADAAVQAHTPSRASVATPVAPAATATATITATTSAVAAPAAATASPLAPAVTPVRTEAVRSTRVAMAFTPDLGHAGAAAMIQALQDNLLAQVSAPADSGEDWRMDVRRFVALQQHHEQTADGANGTVTITTTNAAAGSPGGLPSLARVVRDRLVGNTSAARYPLPLDGAGGGLGNMPAGQRKRRQRQLVRSLLPAVEEMTQARSREEAAVEAQTGARWERSRAGHYSYFEAGTPSRRPVTAKEFERRYRDFTATSSANWRALATPASPQNDRGGSGTARTAGSGGSRRGRNK